MPGLGVGGSKMQKQRYGLAGGRRGALCPHTCFHSFMWAQSPNHKPLVATARMEGEEGGRSNESVVYGHILPSFVFWADWPIPLLRPVSCAVPSGCPGTQPKPGQGNEDRGGVRGRASIASFLPTALAVPLC